MLKNRYKSNSILILALILICACVFVPMMVVQAWFTAGEGKSIEIVAHIADINIKLYQVDDQNNETNIESDTPTYIDLTNGGENLEILPDEQYSLHLVLKNEDVGATSVKLRFSIEFYISTSDGDQLINSEIIGYTNPTNDSNGFIYSNTDNYYVYSSLDGNEQTFPSGSQVDIITGFTIPYNSFIDSNGEPILNGNNLKIVVSVETY